MIYFDNLQEKINSKRCYNLFLEFLFHSKMDPISLNFQQIKTNNNGKFLNELMRT